MRRCRTSLTSWHSGANDCAGFHLYLNVPSENVLFVLSKEEGQPRRGSAVVGLILGVMSTIFGVVEFFCLIQVYHMITDPQYAPFFDQAMELYESLIGPLQ